MIASSEKEPLFHVEHSTLEQVLRCPRCNADTLADALSPKDHTVSKTQFTLTDCLTCGLRITNPRPASNEIGAYYESEEYISHSNAQQSVQDRLYQIARRWALKKKFALVNKFQPKGKVLDLGCGTGEFLAYLKGRGYGVQGVEPSDKARAQAIERYQLTVSPALEKIPSQEQFQVVTMWHVLEHLHDIRGTFKKLFALIEDNGLLVIAVPDRESWDANFFGKFWAAWDVPRHLTHFRREDIHAMLNEHGFTMIATKRMWLDAPYIAMLSARYKGAGTISALVQGLILGGYSNLMSLLSGRPTSSTLYIARRSEL